jgi:hypothetical protein
VRRAGTHKIEVRNEADEISSVSLEVRFKRIHIVPPIGKQKRYPSLDLTVIYATEIDPPLGRKAIIWKLLTDLDVESFEQACCKITWYALRWKIEVFHKIPKSGCRAEDAKLRTADRLANLVAVFCIVSWRVLCLTMMARTAPDAPAAIAMTTGEMTILDHVVSNTPTRGAAPGTLKLYVTKLARLGGYLARASDPPPGNTIIRRGLRRLSDIQLGAEINGVGSYG